jgi:hypothetical protein
VAEKDKYGDETYGTHYRDVYESLLDVHTIICLRLVCEHRAVTIIMSSLPALLP